MKKLLTIFILIGVMIFPMQIHADSFQDQCSSSESTQLRETYNLIVSSYGLQGTITPPLDDLSALSVSDYHQPGELVYAVKNIDHVRVSLYRYFASFAIRYSDGTLAYNTLPNASEQFELLPLWIDRTNDKVYCHSDNQYYLLQFDKLKGYKFSDEPQEPEQALFPYGLSIQESFDGATFEPVEMEMVDVAKFTRDDGKVIFEEVFEADLSTSCRYLKIQIEQFPTIEYIDISGISGVNEIDVSDATMVADVTCTGPQHDQYPDGGAGLPEGITEETDEEEETKQEKSSSSSSSSSTKSSAAGSEETTTIERSSSSETTTSDSNNTSTSTSYTTTNQYYFILSDENSEVMQEVFEQMGIENITKEDSDTAEDTSDGDEQDTVVSVSSDVTAAAVSGQTQTLYSDAQNGNNSSNDILLYYIIFGISLLIVLRVISLVRMPRRRPSDQEDDL